MRILLIFFLGIISCKSKNKIVVTNSILKPVTKLNYDSCKSNVLTKKKALKQKWSYMDTNSRNEVFTKVVVNTIVPAWIGTEWSFNGITEKPGVGSIACGYFVTTVLRDAGLPIARFKLAQCASEQMITTLVQKKYINRFSNVDYNFFINSLINYGKGLYIIGLDNHTGFIYNSGDKILFIHSTFVGTRNVQIEPAKSSVILQNSKYKIIGKISADELVLNKWINN